MGPHEEAIHKNWICLFKTCWEEEAFVIGCQLLIWKLIREVSVLSALNFISISDTLDHCVRSIFCSRINARCGKSVCY